MEIGSQSKKSATAWLDDGIFNRTGRTILPTTPDVYTEIAFKSKDGVQLGTYFNEKTKKWVVFIYTKSYTSRSAKYFDETELSEMIEIMKTAKNKIQELTK